MRGGNPSKRFWSAVSFFNLQLEWKRRCRHYHKHTFAAVNLHLDYALICRVGGCIGLCLGFLLHERIVFDEKVLEFLHKLNGAAFLKRVRLD